MSNEHAFELRNTEQIMDVAVHRQRKPESDSFLPAYFVSFISISSQIWKTFTSTASRMIIRMASKGTRMNVTPHLSLHLDLHPHLQDSCQTTENLLGPRQVSLTTHAGDENETANLPRHKKFLFLQGSTELLLSAKISYFYKKHRALDVFF